MRVVILLFIGFAFIDCSKPASKTPTDFTPYLALKPGTRIKVTPLITVQGDTPRFISDGLKQIEQDGVAIGTLTSITKNQLMIHPDNPKMSWGFKPDGVRSIEVLAPQQ